MMKTTTVKIDLNEKVIKLIIFVKVMVTLIATPIITMPLLKMNPLRKIEATMVALLMQPRKTMKTISLLF